MGNMKELVDRVNSIMTINELKSAILTAMNNANSIEELLILYWHFGKYFKFNNLSIRNNVFAKNVERISYNEALSNSNLIIEDIINDYSLVQIMEKYNVTRESIKRMIISYLESNDYNSAIIEKLSILDENIVPEHDRTFICAVTAFNMFIEHNCLSKREIYRKYNCPENLFSQYKMILENKNHPIYRQYRALQDVNINNKILQSNFKRHMEEKIIRDREISKIHNLSSEELLEVLSSPHSKLFVDFSLYYNINSHLLTELLKNDCSLQFKLVKDRDNIKNIYNECIDKCRNLVKEVIIEIENLRECGFAYPLDLYQYYSKTRFDIKKLARMSADFGEIKNNTLILQYLDKFPFVLEEISRKDITALKQKGIMTCCKDSISFTYSEFNRVLSDIEERRIPLVKGVLYGSIKNQIELRDTNVKKKV